MDTWKSRILILTIVVLLPLEIALLYGLWPYLPIVGKAIAGTAVVACICASVTMIAWTWRRIRAPYVIAEHGVVVMLMRDGRYHHLSAEHEEAKRPLMLPAPAKEDHRSEEDTVLELHNKGISFKTIATSTGWTEYAVRKLCNTHDGKPV